MSRLGDLVTLQRGKTYQSRLLGKPGPVLLGLATIERDGGFRYDNLKTYGGDSPDPLLLKPGDLYVSLKDVTQAGDLLGAVARVPEFIAVGRLTQDTVKLAPKIDGVRLDYVYWLLRTPQYRKFCRAHATGTTNLGLARDDFLSFEVPTLTPEREVLTRVLQSLDDKIEQNRRTSHALEELARATFKAWFVDFEPVKAKAAGETNFPGMPPAAFAALPDRLTDSALGPVPHGWEVVDVYQLANVVYGAPFASKLFNETGDGKPLIRIRDLQTHSPGISTNEQHPKGTLIQPGEIIVGMDGEFRLHYWTGPEAWLNQRLCSFKPLPSVPTMYLGEALREPLDYVERSEAATTVIHLGKYDIDRFELLRPDKVTLAAFDSITSPMLSLIVQTAAESSKLADLRDYLMPRLLNGRVRVSTSGETRGARIVALGPVSSRYPPA